MGVEGRRTWYSHLDRLMPAVTVLSPVTYLLFGALFSPLLSPLSRALHSSLHPPHPSPLFSCPRNRLPPIWYDTQTRYVPSRQASRSSRATDLGCAGRSCHQVAPTPPRTLIFLRPPPSHPQPPQGTKPMSTVCCGSLSHSLFYKRLGINPHNLALVHLPFHSRRCCIQLPWIAPGTQERIQIYGTRV
jgi:hypothetical protein